MERLDKLISNRLCITRKEAKALIRRGQVTLNGAAAGSGEQKCGEGDELLVAGRPLRTSAHIYLMLNKPRDVVCATKDSGCKTVIGLIPPSLGRKGLFPAGRLDKDTEGFVLVTDDGEFAHRILSPKNHLPKTYLARLDAPVDLPRLERAFAEGVDLGGGDHTSPAGLRLVEDGENPLLELIIYEGMYHQVKRMFALFSRKVTHLQRVKIGGLALDPQLPLGGCREMSPRERELAEGLI